MTARMVTEAEGRRFRAAGRDIRRAAVRLAKMMLVAEGANDAPVRDRQAVQAAAEALLLGFEAAENPLDVAAGLGVAIGTYLGQADVGLMGEWLKELQEGVARGGMASAQAVRRARSS